MSPVLQQVRVKTLRISGNIKSQQRNKRHRAEPNGNVRTGKHNNRNKKNLLHGLNSKMEITKQRIREFEDRTEKLPNLNNREKTIGKIEQSLRSLHQYHKG